MTDNTITIKIEALADDALKTIDAVSKNLNSLSSSGIKPLESSFNKLSTNASADLTNLSNAVSTASDKIRVLEAAGFSVTQTIKENGEIAVTASKKINNYANSVSSLQSVIDGLNPEQVNQFSAEFDSMQRSFTSLEKLKTPDIKLNLPKEDGAQQLIDNVGQLDAALKQNRITLDQFESQFKRQGLAWGENGELVDAFTGKTRKYRREVNKAARNLKPFRFEFLSVMFAGMALDRVFGGLIRSQFQLFGVSELFSGVLTVLLLPIMELILPLILQFADFLLNLDDKTKLMIGSIVLGAAALGLFLTVVGNAALAIGGMITLFGGLGTILVLLSPLIIGLLIFFGKDLIDALNGSGKAIDETQTKLTTMGFDGQVISKGFDLVRKAAEKLRDFIKDFSWEDFGKKLQTGINDAYIWFSENIDKFILVGTAIVTSIIQGISNNMPLVTENIRKIVTAIITVIRENLPEIVTIIKGVIVGVAQGLWDGIKENPAEGIAAVGVLASILAPAFVLSFIGTVAKLLGKGLLKIFAGLLTNFSSLAPVLAPIIAIVLGIIDVITNWGENTAKVVGGIIKVIAGVAAIIAVVMGAPALLVAAIVAAVVVIVTLIANNWDKIKQITINLWNSLKEFFLNFWNGLIDFLSGAWSRITTGIVNAFTKIKDFFKNIWEAIKEIFRNALDYVLSVPNKILNGFKNIAKSIKDAVTGILPNWLKKSLKKIGIDIDGDISGSRRYGGYIPETGNYLLHQGEMVIPKRDADSMQSQSFAPIINLTVNGSRDMNEEILSRRISEELNRAWAYKFSGRIR